MHALATPPAGTRPHCVYCGTDQAVVGEARKPGGSGGLEDRSETGPRQRSAGLRSPRTLPSSGGSRERRAGGDVQRELSPSFWGCSFGDREAGDIGQGWKISVKMSKS